MVTPQEEFPRNWVFEVVKGFLTQLKNRLANIKLEYVYANKTLKFFNAENQVAEISLHPVMNNGVLTVRPRYASKHLYGNDLEGYIVIMLPEAFPINTMFSCFVDIYIYKSNRAFNFVLSGYNYQSPHWYNVAAKQLMSIASDYDKVKFVRFLKTGGDANNDNDYTRFGWIIGDDEDIEVPYFTCSIDKIMMAHGASADNVANIVDSNNWIIDTFTEDELPPYKLDYTKVM